MDTNKKIKLIKCAGALFVISLLSALFVYIMKTGNINLNYDAKKDIVLQNDNNNCGPAALKMIFDRYEIAATLDEIENKTNSRKTGTSMLALKEMAELKGLRAEGWRLRLEDLMKCTLPVILFVNGNHYVVLDSVANDTLFINDPALGKLKILKGKISKIWNGETLIFNK